MNILFETLFLVCCLIPGLIYTKRFLVFEGNVSTDHLFSDAIIYGLISALIIHIFSIQIFSIIPSVQQEYSSLASKLKSIIIDDDKATSFDLRWDLFKIGVYFVFTCVFGSVFGSASKKLRLWALYRALNKQNDILYKVMRYDSDWFNLFTGFADLEPVHHLDSVYHTYAPGTYTITKRIVTIEVFLKSECDGKDSDHGEVVDYSLDRDGKLESIIINSTHEYYKYHLEAFEDTNSLQDSKYYNHYKYEDIIQMKVEIYDEIKILREKVDYVCEECGTRFVKTVSKTRWNFKKQVFESNPDTSSWYCDKCDKHTSVLCIKKA
jgi:hypothetical protein